MRHARGECGRAARMDLVGQPSHTDAAIESVNESEKNERDREKCERELIGGCVFDGLHVVVDGDGDGARGAGKISADHEDDAKFTEGVGESENNGGDDSRSRKRKNDLAKRAPRVCAEDAGGGEEFRIEAFERDDEWLNAEWKAVENAGDDEAGERESERVAEEGEPKLAERAVRAHGDKEIETKNGWREDERKSDNGFDEKFCAKFGEGEPVGERRRENKKNRCDEEGEAEGEEEFGHGVGRGFIWEWDGRGIRVWRSRIFRGWLVPREI